MVKEVHVHEWVAAQKPVLLSKHVPEGGQMKYVATTGKDILKQWKCKCGATTTYDLERQKT